MPRNWYARKPRTTPDSLIDCRRRPYSKSAKSLQAQHTIRCERDQTTRKASQGIGNSCKCGFASLLHCDRKSVRRVAGPKDAIHNEVLILDSERRQFTTGARRFT